MRWIILVMLLTALTTLPDLAEQRESAQVFFATGNAHSLDSLFQKTSSREVQLLCRYRLYPLTENTRYLENLPDDLSGASARELALLSGLWGYRLRDAFPLQLARLGLRSHRLLERAKTLDANEPYVLLVEGQSLLFRPPIFGGNVEAAAQRFHQLRTVLAAHSSSGIAPMEAAIWEWYALMKLGAPEAPVLRAQLLSEHPPALYRQFLLSPP